MENQPLIEQQKVIRQPKTHFKWGKNIALYVMLIPGIVLTLIFSYLPMGGLVIAFQDYKPWLGMLKSNWVQWDHFAMMFLRDDSVQIIWNTLIISSAKLTAGLIIPIVFSLLLNEVRQLFFKKTVQTLVYLPHFLSWVILGGILTDLLSSSGLINSWVEKLNHGKPILFLADGDWFRIIVVISDIWKEFGFATIVFLAALAGVNPSLYEAAEVDGAGRWKQTLNITLPAIAPIIVVVGTLSLGNILNAGFDQIFNLYNPLVYSKGDIIDTFVYRTGIISGGFSFATAVGMFKSVIGFILIALAYWSSGKFANYRIF
ncbi:putative aldouronate transport system permease protein [Paenibacillus castaneae]|uniref:ABC transporter permease n=1 Tax=Paenibacillus castaneae TaxID=474957 RepID=UPI000C9A4A97|nr:ABC transporter permease subunit [Paenibacillus castaneae]NIK78074.1 putative aldouronate transport system permease protein [Paenibacillus castaneae]